MIVTKTPDQLRSEITIARSQSIELEKIIEEKFREVVRTRSLPVHATSNDYGKREFTIRVKFDELDEAEWVIAANKIVVLINEYRTHRRKQFKLESDLAISEKVNVAPSDILNSLR